MKSNYKVIITSINNILEWVWVKKNLIVFKSEDTNEKHIIYNLWAYNLKTRSLVISLHV